MQHIIIDYPPASCEVYPLTTDSEVAEAQAALRDAGKRYAKIYVGDGVDLRPTGDVLWAIPGEPVPDPLPPSGWTEAEAWR